MNLTSQTRKGVAALSALVTVAALVAPASRYTAGQNPAAPITPPVMTSPPGAGAVEQRSQGALPGAATLRNPSDNSLAVGPDHIMQTVNTRIAVFTKKGKRFDTTGKVLYGPATTNTIFAGLTGPCEARNNGDAVVRYDQLADRWLVVMPIFSRIPLTDVGERPPIEQAAPKGVLAAVGQASSPGPAAAMPPNPPQPPPPPQGQGRGRGQTGQPAPPPPPGTYAM